MSQFNLMIDKLIFQKRIFVILIIFFILILAFFLRVYFSFETVFSYPIKYASDDGVYHMRIVENQLLGNHFPKRIYFDPYTNFPQGTFIHFGPLYDYLLAFIIWILSLGNPTQEVIDLISPFYPPVLGVLAVLVVYFLGRILWNNTIGIIAALITAISPMLIFRSLLGAVDHHVAEYLFSSLAVLFLISLLKFQKKQNFYSIKWWFLVILTGFSLGLYFLVWEGALLFLLIFFLFFSSYALQQYISQKPWKQILVSALTIFFIVLLMLIPFLGHPNLSLSPLYNLLHIGSIVFSLSFFLTILFLGKIFSPQKKLWFLLIFILTGLFCLFFIYLISPETIYFLLNGLKFFNLSFIEHEKAREMVSEMGPLTLQGAINTFLAIFFFSLAGLIIVIYEFIKKRQAKDLLIIIWFLITFIITGIFPFFGQIKYAYYFLILGVLLSALFFERAFIFAWRGIKISQEEYKKNPSLSNRALIGSVLIIFFLLSFLLYPFPFNIASSYPENLPLIIRHTIQLAKSVISHHQDYYEAYKWLRQNTPSLSLDYYGLYQEPEIDLERKKILPYNYPLDSYGVLARWDLGHSITYYAQRPVISNPFQQGIGRKKGDQVKEIGEAIFFVETDEKKAMEYLDKLKARYLITDGFYAYPEGYFKGAVKWIQGDLKGYTENDIGEAPHKFDISMISRLHIFDGRSFVVERKKEEKTLQFKIKPLNNFRLVYESETLSNFHKDEKNIKLVKIFEYVKGARIIGKTKAGNKVSISSQIKTNQKREFIYEEEIETSDGYFEFIVPYSTFGSKGWIEKGTKFAVFAKPYKIKIGKKEVELKVSEEDVLEGREIKIDSFN